MSLIMMRLVVNSELSSTQLRIKIFLFALLAGEVSTSQVSALLSDRSQLTS